MQSLHMPLFLLILSGSYIGQLKLSEVAFLAEQPRGVLKTPTNTTDYLDFGLFSLSFCVQSISDACISYRRL